MRPIALLLAGFLLCAGKCGKDTVIAAGFGTSCRNNGDCSFGSSCRHGICTPGDCQSDLDCNDGLFCTGEEVCFPNDNRADERGCITPGSPCTGTDVCDEIEEICARDCGQPPDADGDGVRNVACGGDDCDDADPLRFPGNAEVCDAAHRDEDCDPTTFGERDADGDGFFAATCCNDDGSDGLACGSDCNDGDPSVHGIAPEVCNGGDDDCDGAVDEGAMVTMFTDMDRDGHGQPGTGRAACAGSPGLSTLDNDCDDANPAVQPGSQVCSPKQGQLLVCSPDGAFVETSCGGQGVCRPQPNGTGICF